MSNVEASIKCSRPLGRHMQHPKSKHVLSVLMWLEHSERKDQRDRL